MKSVAPHTRVCAYDRAGRGMSDAAPLPRTSLDVATDIYTFLNNAGLAGPYILVGHSAGGLNVLVSASQYPEDIVRMVLADASNPDACQRQLESLPYEYTGEPSDVANCRGEFKSCIKFWKSSGNMEGWDFATSGEQVKSVISLGDLPLIVITDTFYNACKGELGAIEDQIWKDLHPEYVALSTNGTQVFTDSGHMLPTTNPHAVVEAILQVLEQARNK